MSLFEKKDISKSVGFTFVIWVHWRTEIWEFELVYGLQYIIFVYFFYIQYLIVVRCGIRHDTLEACWAELVRPGEKKKNKKTPPGDALNSVVWLRSIFEPSLFIKFQKPYLNNTHLVQQTPPPLLIGRNTLRLRIYRLNQTIKAEAN